MLKSPFARLQQEQDRNNVSMTRRLLAGVVLASIATGAVGIEWVEGLGSADNKQAAEYMQPYNNVMHDLQVTDKINANTIRIIGSTPEEKVSDFADRVAKPEDQAIVKDMIVAQDGTDLQSGTMAILPVSDLNAQYSKQP